MSPIFKVGGKFLAFGLNWEAFTGPKAEKLAKARAKEDDVPYMVCLKEADGGRFGYLRDFDTEATNGKPKKGTMLSGAALLATLPEIAENAILIHPYKPLGAEQRVLAVVILYRGAIFEDRVNIRAMDVHDHLDRVVQILRDSASGDDDADLQFTRYTTDAVHYPDAQPLTLENLLEGEHAAASVVDAKSYLAIRLTMVAIIVAGAAYLGWGEWEDYQQRQQIAAVPVQQAPTPAELYQQSLNAALRQIGVKPEAFATIALKAMGERETSVEGYELDTTACDDTGLCTENWVRIEGVGVLDRFVAGNEGAMIAPSSDGKSLTLTYRLELPRAATTRQQLPTSAAFSVPMQSLLQRYAAIGMTSTTQALKLIGLPAGMQEGTVPAGIGVAGGEVTLDGPSGYLSEILGNDIPEELRLPENFYITEVKYNKVAGPVDKSTFTLKGNFYVQR